jgi:hypothetical protein
MWIWALAAWALASGLGARGRRAAEAEKAALGNAISNAAE